LILGFGCLGGEDLAKPQIDRATYFYLEQLSRSGFAWEFLRRNAHYQRDWNSHRTAMPRRNVSRDGIEFFVLNRRFWQAEKWSLRSFQDPSMDARTACLFWLPDALSRSVEGKAVLNATDGAQFVISDMVGTRAVLVDAAGVIHVAIDSHFSSVGLSILDLPRPFSKFAIIFQVPAFAAVRRRFEAILDIEWRSSRPLPQASSAESQNVQARMKLVHCVIAIDARRQGLSYRDLAVLLFGADAVAKDWNGPSRFLKDRIRRIVERGEALVNGTYRDLLR
jgi:hypothetical protein